MMAFYALMAYMAIDFFYVAHPIPRPLSAARGRAAALRQSP
jgi:hypothetical protein